MANRTIKGLKMGVPTQQKSGSGPSTDGPAPIWLPNVTTDEGLYNWLTQKNRQPSLNDTDPGYDWRRHHQFEEDRQNFRFKNLNPGWKPKPRPSMFPRITPRRAARMLVRGPWGLPSALLEYWLELQMQRLFEGLAPLQANNFAAYLASQGWTLSSRCANQQTQKWSEFAYAACGVSTTSNVEGTPVLATSTQAVSYWHVGYIFSTKRWRKHETWLKGVSGAALQDYFIGRSDQKGRPAQPGDSLAPNNDPFTEPEAQPVSAPAPMPRLAPYVIRRFNARHGFNAYLPNRGIYEPEQQRGSVLQPKPKPTTGVQPGTGTGGGGSSNPPADPPVIDPAGRPLPRHELNKPGRHVHERKIKNALPQAIAKLVNWATEGSEIVDAAYGALRCEYQNKYDSMPDKLRKLYEFYYDIDPAKFVWNLLMNQVEDKLIGIMAKKENERKQWLFDNYGVQTINSATTQISRIMSALDRLEMTYENSSDTKRREREKRNAERREERRKLREMSPSEREIYLRRKAIEAQRKAMAC